MAKNLRKEIDKIKGLKDKTFEVFGMDVSYTTLTIALAGIGSIIGVLYAGFVMYQKIESVASLDIGKFEQRMEVIETQMEKTVDYTRDIKNGLRDDIQRIENQSDRTEDLVRDSIDDVRNMIDDAEARFETKRDQLRQSVSRDTKELEDRLQKKIQRALDNPLAN